MHALFDVFVGLYITPVTQLFRGRPDETPVTVEDATIDGDMIYEWAYAVMA